MPTQIQSTHLFALNLCKFVGSLLTGRIKFRNFSVALVLEAAGGFQLFEKDIRVSFFTRGERR